MSDHDHEKGVEQTPGVVFDSIVSRRSTPKLVAPGPEASQLQRILLAGECAPDHGLLKPWRFYIVSGEARARLGALFAQADTVDQSDQRAVEKATSMPLRAPLLIVITSTCTLGSKFPELEQMMAVSAAVQNMQLVAHEEGFAAMWRTGTMAYDPHVKRCFNVAEHDQIIGFLYVGTPEKVPAPRNLEKMAARLNERAFEWQGQDQVSAWQALED